MMSSSSKQQEAGPKLFSSRILRDRSSVTNASFRVYYSLGAGTVPFLWESKPGTPKSSVTPASAAATARTTVPPISPPPSYQQSAAASQSKAKTKLRKRSASFPPRGWIIGWLNLNVRRRSPPSSPAEHQQRCLDHGVVDGGERRSRRSTLCF